MVSSYFIFLRTNGARCRLPGSSPSKEGFRARLTAHLSLVVVGMVVVWGCSSLKATQLRGGGRRREGGVVVVEGGGRGAT